MASTVSPAVKRHQIGSPASTGGLPAAETAGPAKGTLSRLLRDSVERHPDRISVEDPTSGAAITYRELGERTGELRDALERHGINAGDRVGVCAPKSVATVTAIFGILEARAAYVPVDAGAPPQRNAGIFEDCSVRMMVVAKSLVDDLRTAAPEYRLDTLQELRDDLLLVRGMENESVAPLPAATAAQEGPSPTDLAYILYTSGSTGKPKGVIHTHASALSFVDWCSGVFEPTELDRFSSHAPFHFDLSILDLYVPIKHGATLVLIGEEVGKQPLRLASLIAEQRITVWYSTPSILRLLADFGRLARYDHSSLRLVLFAGEVFPVKHLRTLKAFWPRPRYFNLYGPTETNVCTFLEVPAEIPDSQTAPFPIGWTCMNDRTRVVDEHDQDVACGEEGELCVSGGTVMQGYWNLPERTEHAFLRDSAGLGWYRTGDVVRESDDGCYDYIGRRDRMVKRRGYRVELAEIEAALYRHPSIAAAAVTASPDEDSGVRLDAFVVCSIGTRCSVIEMKQFCAENLPMYMVPDRFIFREAFPETSTGKIDYQQLKGSSLT
ncbi:MAG: amino acid adenylation domain-containing protein [Gemmatimonadaceae bacterium]|nr:amino acid adenylation domain-containing protein [Gemmatimonadaceae bacterium]